MRRGKKRRILALLLCFLMIFSLTVSAYAEKSTVSETIPHISMRLATDSDADGDIENVAVEETDVYVHTKSNTNAVASPTNATVTSVTADVYVKQDGIYTLVNHGKDTPLSMSEYHEQTVYVLTNEKPQDIYFEQKTPWDWGIIGTRFELNDKTYATLTANGAVFGASKAVVTLAANAPAEAQVTLSTDKYTVTIEVLDEIPGTGSGSVVKKEVSVGGTAIRVSGSGIPKDVELQAMSVTADQYHENLLEQIADLSKLLFAFDITLLDKDGNVWQPTEGTSVTVTLDVSAMGVEDGTKVGILHDHDGELGKLGEYTVEDGMLSFETDGFSVFYGYTVDFEYNGKTFSMPGGNYIYLSELFEALEIEKSVNDVEEVTFTNEELVTLVYFDYTEEEGGGQDWRLVSLQPFDTNEELTIVFSDGEEMVIRVTDKNWGTEDIDGDETWSNDDSQGNRKVTENSTITIKTGATIELKGTITIPEGKTLTIQCNGEATLKRTSENDEDVPLFNVNGGKLVIKSSGGTITVDGNKVEVGRSAFIVGVNSRADWNTKNDNGGSTLTLTNVTIKDCYCNDNGYAGAIDLIAGSTSADDSKYYRPLHNLTLENCVIDNCRSPHGSAIYFRGNSMGKATITNTVIQNCVAYGKLTTDSDDQGGTIRSNGNNGSFVVLEHCIIKNNRSGYSDLNTVKSGSRCYGGGIYWNAAGALSKSYTDSIDTSNTRAKMYIYDCQILDNKATNRGGGIFNEAAMDIGTKYTEGFTTDRLSDTSSIKGTLIDGNYAGGYTSTDFSDNCGGGIMVPSYGGGASESKDMDVSLNMGKGVYITNNSSKHGGGFAMQINQTDDKNEGVTFSVDYDGAVIKNNTATENGGGIYIIMLTKLYKSDLNLVSGTIANNNAQNGGGIYVENTNINIGTSATTADNAVQITGNTATGNGGGIYLKQEEAYESSVQINVSYGYVTGNTAIGNGGGIYQTGNIGNCVVTGEGRISDNTAANGGGIYITGTGGSKLSVTGGIITENKAVGSSSAQTAQNAACGVVGGIYVEAGSFSLSGDHVGLHSNIASVAANDAYASGNSTTLTLPDVKKMDLAGWNGTGKPEGWFADYMENDSEYPGTIINKENPGRYEYYDPDKVEVVHSTILVPNQTTYYCLTIGTPHPGYGNLTITKTLGNNEVAKEDQTFIFEVSGTTRNPETNYSMTAALVIKKGESSATVTIANIPDGTYTVEEKSSWSWRYDFKSHSFNPKDGAAISEEQFTVGVKDPEWEANFVNSYKTSTWLSGDCYCENWFSSDGILKRDSQNKNLSGNQ